MTQPHPDKKALRRQYKETARPAGVYAVRNALEAISLVGTSPDVPSMLNRQRFQLDMGVHPVKDLQEDWGRLGADAFTFETLDLLEPGDADSEADLKKDLAALLALWRVRLESGGEKFYDAPGAKE